jgi:hypothetical protein
MLFTRSLIYRLEVSACLLFSHLVSYKPVTPLFFLGMLWYYTTSLCTIKASLLLPWFGSKVSCLVLPLLISIQCFTLLFVRRRAMTRLRISFVSKASTLHSKVALSLGLIVSMVTLDFTLFLSRLALVTLGALVFG